MEKNIKKRFYRNKIFARDKNNIHTYDNPRRNFKYFLLCVRTGLPYTKKNEKRNNVLIATRFQYDFHFNVQI